MLREVKLLLKCKLTKLTNEKIVRFCEPQIYCVFHFCVLFWPCSYVTIRCSKLVYSYQIECKYSNSTESSLHSKQHIKVLRYRYNSIYCDHDFSTVCREQVSTVKLL